ncbi:biotin--[acetyl-CoA-carboxylase] ligase [Piscinibacter koreensis]|uniref:biotin--[biotin carboxyl-carrier protein] ligase n=1 Tax=Piscinibacter koreensis TaxID=2742824 RepID=A0A7Y6NKE3_9BURK|nr:biotin--[acetyl-CoA-carboxylase] ligase [Schlegelella koreensis]NUZ04706.1 biotin--[acetyl-CoA-carboxylase] ligase [Schlegelella koreensis]
MAPDSAWPASEALEHELDALLPGIEVERVVETGSTSTDLLERARMTSLRDDAGAGIQLRRSVEAAAFGRRAPEPFRPCLRIAERQTAGRGRHGRNWHAAPGASLTFSLALSLERADWSGLSLAVGVALADALDPPGGAPRVGLKWPNDLWLVDASGGRKLGGVLIESVARGAERIAVVGCGLNVAAQAVADASTGVASWNEIEPAASAGRALMRVARPLAEALRRFERDGFAAFAAGFATRDVLRGRAVRSVAGAPLDGVAEGIAPDGALLVRAPDGTLRRVESGEVSVRPVGPAVASMDRH